MTDNAGMTYYKQNPWWVAIISVILTVLGTLVVLLWAGWLTPPQINRQTTVHDMGAGVMPFDLGKTTHIFEMTDSGGIQQVIADDPDDSAQIALIQQHIRHEAMQFSAGDFSDPTSLHGVDMPGIEELAENITKIKIEFATLPAGAEITFTTQDIGLITAIHRWFGAQLSDHSSDATYR